MNGVGLNIQAQDITLLTPSGRSVVFLKCSVAPSSPVEASISPLIISEVGAAKSLNVNVVSAKQFKGTAAAPEAKSCPQSWMELQYNPGRYQ